MKRRLTARLILAALTAFAAASPHSLFSQATSNSPSPAPQVAPNTAGKSQVKVDKAARRAAARKKEAEIKKQGAPARHPYKRSVEMPSDI
ncbi:hypothetical protein [Pelagicoccus mobilis]|uniref:Uncharacterized protein n=1 Tax=Pelagicoccus mobilis TaxID=415221 RepID=A0A934RUQ8_9BACT|nr:hypothetical protein [Pelagicoccus mobilis]MBK1878005.1 hypothetical protein [Pelagicoccus mobilis]